MGRNDNGGEWKGEIISIITGTGKGILDELWSMGE
jgi:hypothetical protein